MSYFKSVSVPSNKPNADTYECCEHVEKDWSLACQGTAEADCWGSDIPYFRCQACVDAEGEEPHMDPCDDCGCTVKVKDMTEWKAYDFYAPQGDVPYYLCSTCVDAPKHRARVAEDTRHLEAERADQDALDEEYQPWEEWTDEERADWNEAYGPNSEQE